MDNRDQASDKVEQVKALSLDAAEFDRQMRKALSKPPMSDTKGKRTTAKKPKKPPKR